MITLQGIYKSFAASKRRPPVTALADVSVDFRDGETTVLVGPSGSGKSTILRLINGLVRPDRGQVIIAGRPLEKDTVVALRRRMGYVIQDGGLFPHLTALENITLAARTLGPDGIDIDSRVRTLAEMVKLPVSRLRDYPAHLSGGQRQRVSLMRALMMDPMVLLLDEPLGALDPMIRASLQDELKHLFARLGKTVIMVTHDLAEAALLGARIVLMHEGRFAQIGTINDLVNRPKNDFVSRFVAAHRSGILAGD